MDSNPAASGTKPTIRLIVISGRSGSGKSVALHSLEDLGFYCIDNLPALLLPQLITLARRHYPKLAVSIDVRNLPAEPEALHTLYRSIRNDPGIHSTIIFIDAEDQVLIKRYAETRRLHPLSHSSLSLDDAVSREATLLKEVAAVADLRLDSTNLSVHDLASEIVTGVQGHPGKQLLITFESFGFRDGIAKDADFVFDSRFLPNPYWQPELRSHSGLEEPVRRFFAGYPQMYDYIDHLDRLLMFWLPAVENSNRSYLTVAIGCTGGFHRSVYIAEELYARFCRRGLNARVRHRALKTAKI